MKSYKQFIKKYPIEDICKQYNISSYSINTDGSIDVDGNVELSNKKLTKLPLRFRNVSGYFDCEYNLLTSLEGCPNSVGGFFDCSGNQLTSLVGCPEIIGAGFFCNNNKITDFKGISEFFENDFYCNRNPIKEICRLFGEDDSKYIKWINEFDVIDGNKIIIDRLEEVYHQLGMDIPENIYLPSYEII